MLNLSCLATLCMRLQCTQVRVAGRSRVDPRRQRIRTGAWICRLAGKSFPGAISCPRGGGLSRRGHGPIPGANGFVPIKSRKCNGGSALAYDMRINDPIWESPQVNALPSSATRDLGAAIVDPGASQSPHPARYALWRMFTTPGLRQNFIILTVFWIYVAFSNVLYANSMQASFNSMPGQFHVFAPSSARLLQHLLIYPVLLLCTWASLRIGWRSLSC